MSLSLAILIAYRAASAGVDNNGTGIGLASRLPLRCRPYARRCVFQKRRSATDSTLRCRCSIRCNHNQRSLEMKRRISNTTGSLHTWWWDFRASKAHALDKSLLDVFITCCRSCIFTYSYTHKFILII